ncbi:DUF1444 domain-containing protein [Eikenella sp. Marseille-P7795]|uniref:DUF1444 domain-containing protein n=1 Tax=Eikenella sp. Marseille-P7795 TaxID=2866577 RepID=UPI001CE3F9D1|nr:DUF1444 domain-containing protein [Eikenella sp. Marseille-P7795]
MSFFKKLFGGRQKLLSWVQFTELFAQRIRQDCHEEVEIQWGNNLEDTTVLVTRNNGQLYLGNHYANYLDDPEELEAILAANIATVRQMLEPTPPLRAEQIFPVIKDALWLENIRQMHQANHPDTDLDNAVICYPIAGDIVLAYVADSGETMRFLNQEAIGINGHEMLHQTAIDNLWQHMQGKIEIARIENSSLSQIMLDTVYDASLSLLLGSILPEDPVLSDNPIFILPRRNTLMLCNPSDSKAVKTLKTAAQQLEEEGPYAISTQLYQYHNGKISLFQPH